MTVTWLPPGRPRPIDIDPRTLAWVPAPAEDPKNGDEEVAGNGVHRDSPDTVAVVACVADADGATDREGNEDMPAWEQVASFQACAVSESHLYLVAPEVYLSYPSYLPRLWREFRRSHR